MTDQSASLWTAGFRIRVLTLRNNLQKTTPCSASSSDAPSTLPRQIKCTSMNYSNLSSTIAKKKKKTEVEPLLFLRWYWIWCLTEAFFLYPVATRAGKASQAGTPLAGKARHAILPLAETNSSKIWERRLSPQAKCSFPVSFRCSKSYQLRGAGFFFSGYIRTDSSEKEQLDIAPE